MKNWPVTYWTILLVAALAAAFFFGQESVHTVSVGGSENSYGHRSVVPSQPVATSQVRASRLKAGERFDSLNDLVNDQLLAGFVRVGLFGKRWPATVTEIATDRDGITFVKQDGIRHSYTKFAGYKMKMVRLRAGNQETIVVFRAQEQG